MKRINTPFQNTERGQSLMELAVSLTILLMLLTGAVETSLALFQFVTLRDAAQEGALYGSIALATADVNNNVGNAVQGIEWRTIKAADDVVDITPANINVYINKNTEDTEIFATDTTVAHYCEGSTGGLPNSITVTVTFAHPITLPFVAPMLGRDTINLTASSTSTILQPSCP